MGSAKLGLIGASTVARVDISPGNARIGTLESEGDRTIKGSVHNCGHFKLSRKEKRPYPKLHNTSGSYGRGFPLRPELLH